MLLSEQLCRARVCLGPGLSGTKALDLATKLNLVVPGWLFWDWCAANLLSESSPSLDLLMAVLLLPWVGAHTAPGGLVRTSHPRGGLSQVPFPI